MQCESKPVTNLVTWDKNVMQISEQFQVRIKDPASGYVQYLVNRCLNLEGKLDWCGSQTLNWYRNSNLSHTETH